MKKIIFIFFVTLILCCNFSSATMIENNINLKNIDSDFYTFKEYEEILIGLKENYSEILTYWSIGKTFEKRNIWLVKISDNVSIKEDEPRVLFSACMHGYEKVGFNVLIHSIISIVENYSRINVNLSFSNRIRQIVNNSELYFIPIVNPDGYVSNIRKNKEPNNCLFGKTLFRGVDLNRNFDHKWQEYDKHPFYYFLKSGRAPGIRIPIFDFWLFEKSGNGVYRGPYPFSENETIALKNFFENHNIKTGIDYHSKGKKILYPWAWTEKPPEDKNLFLSMAQNFSRFNNFGILQFSKWYHMFGSFNDWTYSNFNTIHFTIELDSIESTSISKTSNDHLYVNLYLAERTINMK